MEKKIILTMQPSKDIIVEINEHDKIVIEKNNREVTADAIYNLLNYHQGDVYTVESVNTQKIDEQVLQFFKELIVDIINRLNNMSRSVQ